MADLLLRWCLGIQDTTRLDSLGEGNSKLHTVIWLAKLSIASFQRWFPDARFMLFYNGDDIAKFRKAFDLIDITLSKEVEFVDQIKEFRSGRFKNPYHYFPQGVWWKWVPFRYDLDYHEISVDTDIICINDPLEWKEWINNDNEIIIAPERFSEIVVNTCGDFHKHPILRNKLPLNCGIVGHRVGCDYSERFFDITREIRYGYTHDSLFITEQGAINVWVYSLQNEGISPYVLDFAKCAWVRDFIFYLEKGIRVETIHATTWHKQIVKNLGDILIRRVVGDYSDKEFVCDIISAAKEMDFYSQHVVRRQLGEDRDLDEYYF